MTKFIRNAFLISIIFLPLLGSSQIFTGGTFGVYYDNGVYVDLAPEIGYRYQRVEAGISPFVSYREIGDQHRYSFGNRIFTRITVYKDIFLHGEFQLMNIEIPGSTSSGFTFENRKWILSMPIGAGYKYKISDKAYAHGSILYDVMLDKDSPVQNPIIRGGIIYNF